MTTKRDQFSAQKLSHIEEFFKACADQTRLRILSLLASAEEICVCHLVDVLQTNQPKVSRHLAYLKRAGLVTDRKGGLWVYYRLTPPQNESVEGLLSSLQVCCAGLAEIQRDALSFQSLQPSSEPLVRSMKPLAALSSVASEDSKRTELQVELL